MAEQFSMQEDAYKQMNPDWKHVHRASNGEGDVIMESDMNILKWKSTQQFQELRRKFQNVCESRDNVTSSIQPNNKPKIQAKPKVISRTDVNRADYTVITPVHASRTMSSQLTSNPTKEFVTNVPNINTKNDIENCEMRNVQSWRTYDICTSKESQEKLKPEVIERNTPQVSQRAKHVMTSEGKYFIPENIYENREERWIQSHSNVNTLNDKYKSVTTSQIPGITKRNTTQYDTHLETSRSPHANEQYFSSEDEGAQSLFFQETRNSEYIDRIMQKRPVERIFNCETPTEEYKPVADRQIPGRVESEWRNINIYPSTKIERFGEDQYTSHNPENNVVFGKTNLFSKQPSVSNSGFQRWNLETADRVNRMDSNSSSTDCSDIQKKYLVPDDSYLNKNAEILYELSDDKYLYFRILRDLYKPQVTERSKRLSIDSAISLESNTSKLNKPVNSNWECIAENESYENERNIKKYKNEISSAIKEFVESELVYVHNLGYILDNYMSPITHRIDVRKQHKTHVQYLFGDIEEIYHFHKTYLVPQLLKCGEDCRNVADMFNNFSEQFGIYEIYHSSRFAREAAMDIFESFLEQIRVNIDDKLGLRNHFILPTQRLIKYSQLILRIIESLTKLEKVEIDMMYQVLHINKTKFTLEALEKALNMIKNLLQRADDLHIIDMIKNSPVELIHSNLVQFGKLVRKHNLFNIVIYMILFKNLVMFTVHKREDMNGFYYYKDHMFLSEMKAPIKSKSDSFMLETNSKEILLKADNTIERDKWVAKINELLLEQFNLKHHSVDSNTSVQRVKSVRNLLPEIQNNPIDLSHQGRIVHRSQMTICKNKQTYIGEVFQFQKIIIFASLENQHFDKTFIYEDSIYTRDVYIDTNFEYSLTKFRLLSHTSDVVYVLQARSSEDKTDFIRNLPVSK